MQDSTIAIEDQHGSNQPDFMFGVCEAIGEDLGFNPFFLRVALLALLFFSPVAMLATYAALGGTVALSRWLFPKTQAATVAAMVQVVEPVRQLEAEREPELIAA